ncbi:hypothetical protein J2S77_001981 [Alkalibacillus salilacus]|uniref:Uncharacterized protein n=2 Tax=Alkalibacillus salilacus TaxID=284582 RepID=A0ABT9VGF7_9BACI|nr:hypothetical protein [Alkalibacillus salilacus]
MTWFYPYSMLSIHKSYSFTPDSVVVENYAEDLKIFNEAYEEDLEALESADNIDLTVDRTQYLLPMYEQDWLTSDDTVEMDKEKLDKMLFEVKNGREYLLELMVRKDYSEDQKDYLANVISGLLSLEDQLIDLKNGTAESRKTLNSQIRNVQSSFESNFMVFKTFYERSKDN